MGLAAGTGKVPAGNIIKISNHHLVCKLENRQYIIFPVGEPPQYHILNRVLLPNNQ
jgi:hypothetical protein